MQKNKITFWDFCAPIYDFAQRQNSAFKQSVRAIYNIVPKEAKVLDVATGAGEISIALAAKAKEVVGADLSEKMINIANKKIAKSNLQNVKFEIADIYNLQYKDNSFDVVIASQVLHLLDEPEKAAKELQRISSKIVIVPVCLLKNLKFFAKIKVVVWQLLGFAPKNEFDAESYKAFLTKIGLPPSDYRVYNGDMPMVVAVWEKINHY